jgi:hypothetical protein
MLSGQSFNIGEKMIYACLALIIRILSGKR